MTGVRAWRGLPAHCKCVENCATCAHSNDADAVVPDLYTYCTLAGGFYNGKLLERTTRCARWEARDHA